MQDFFFWQGVLVKLHTFFPFLPCICPIMHFLISIYNLDEHVQNVAGNRFASIIESTAAKMSFQCYFPLLYFTFFPAYILRFLSPPLIFYIPGSRLTQLQIPLQVIKQSSSFWAKKYFSREFSCGSCATFFLP